MAKPIDQNAVAEEKAVMNGSTEPASPVTVVRAKVSTPVAADFRDNAERWGVEYGVLLEMAMLCVMDINKAGLRGFYDRVQKNRSDSLFKD